MSDATSNPDNVVPLNRLSDADYDRERERIRETYGESNRAAGVRWEQELAKFFKRAKQAGWTQERLAEKEGKSRVWVSRQLTFGDFLTESLGFSENVPNWYKLTEGKFRSYWEQTNQTESDTARFRRVVELIREDEANPPMTRSNPVAVAIRERYTDDGRWHNPYAIAAALNQPVTEVERAFKSMSKRGTNPVKIESEKRGMRHPDGRREVVVHHKIHSLDRAVSYHDIKTKLAPIIERLDRQGRASMATVAISTMRLVADELQEIVDAWGR